MKKIYAILIVLFISISTVGVTTNIGGNEKSEISNSQKTGISVEVSNSQKNGQPTFSVDDQAKFSGNSFSLER